MLDAGAAARIAGYHVAALRLIAADPDAEPARQSLLSADEVRFQIEGLAGPRRDLPDWRFHELFEQRVAAHPDAIAAIRGGGGGPTPSSTPAPTGWAGPCWPAGCAARTWSRW